MIEYRYPLHICAGDESAGIALKLFRCRYRRRITFHWGPGDQVWVVGAHMICPNVFEYPPHTEEQNWYLKYSVGPNAPSSRKQPYLTVHELRDRKWPVYAVRFVAGLLFFIPLLLLILRFLGVDGGALSIGIGSYVLPIPITALLLFLTWSSKVTEFIQRLFAVSKEVSSNPPKPVYEGKGVGPEAAPMRVYASDASEEDKHDMQFQNGGWSEWLQVF